MPIHRPGTDRPTNGDAPERRRCAPRSAAGSAPVTTGRAPKRDGPPSERKGNRSSWGHVRAPGNRRVPHAFPPPIRPPSQTPPVRPHQPPPPPDLRRDKANLRFAGPPCGPICR